MDLLLAPAEGQAHELQNPLRRYPAVGRCPVDLLFSDGFLSGFFASKDDAEAFFTVTQTQFKTLCFAGNILKISPKQFY